MEKIKKTSRLLILEYKLLKEELKDTQLKFTDGDRDLQFRLSFFKKKLDEK